MNYDFLYKNNENTIWKLEKNFEFANVSEKELTMDLLMELYFRGVDIIYIVNNGVLDGIITNKEIIQTLRNRKISINRNFIKIVTGEAEYKQAMDTFWKVPVIAQIPVVSKDGVLLYEYRKAFSDSEKVKEYYDNIKVDMGVNTTESRNKKIIVSMTSYGYRLKTVYLSILSMMTQTVKPDKIILYVAHDSVQYIPDDLRALQDNGLTLIEGVDNLMVHKKYYYALRDYSEELVITVDDDVMYEDTFIEGLYNSYLEDKDAVSYRRTHQILADNGTVKPYTEWVFNDSSIDRPSHVLFGTSVGGEIYPPHCMDERVLDMGLCKKLAFYQDDMWMKYMQLLKGTKVKYVRGKAGDCISIPGSQKISCAKLNVEGGWNDVYIEKLSEFFGINLADYC